MKDITRIQIAKTSYDIELTAKATLKAYIDDLSAFAEDDNVLEDIEIRIAELLASRGVNPNDSISKEDVAFIRSTLGEPAYFSGEGDMAIGDDSENKPTKGHKYFRDIDSAVLGGVLGGFAHYLRINPVWTRLAFIVLLLVSFGLAALIYIVLWVSVPAAKTVTEKLQMNGKPVTLRSIRQYKETQQGSVSTVERMKTRRKVFGVTIGILGVIGSIMTALFLTAGIVAWNVAQSQQQLPFENVWVIFSLAVASGALLLMLMLLVSYAGFKGKVSKSAVISSIAIIVAGVITFSTAAGMVGYQTWQRDQAVQASIKERSITLPTNFAQVKILTVDATNLMVEYRVSDDVRATLTGVPGFNVKVTQDGSSATIKSEGTAENTHYLSVPTLLTIYGPAVDTLAVLNGSIQYGAKTQDITILATHSATVDVSGNFNSLTVETKDGAAVVASSASVKQVSATMEAMTTITLANVERLRLVQPTACPTTQRAELSVGEISSSTISYNDTDYPKVSRETACGRLTIETGIDSRSYN